MILKEIGRKIAQAFRLARAADEKVRKGEKRWQKLRSGREAKTKPEASC